MQEKKPVFWRDLCSDGYLLDGNRLVQNQYCTKNKQCLIFL